MSYDVIEIGNSQATAISMSLRDWLAGLAMQQQIENPLQICNAESRSIIAARAYAMADDMLKAREAR